MTTDHDRERRVADLEREIREKRAQLARLRRQSPPEQVEDYAFQGPKGTLVRLSELFEGERDLFVVHNMGVTCPYGTLWADGLNGIYPHVRSRAAFALVSPDAPPTQAAFAAQRGWRFPMVSNGDSSFTEDMGFLVEADGELEPAPGVSAFRLQDDRRIRRVASARFGPGDPFCAAFHLFDLLDGGAGGWEPRLTYPGAAPARKGS